MENGKHLKLSGGGARSKQERDAKEMEKAVAERAKRLGIQAPPYDFLELIGKGSYGRVFTSRRHGEQTVVAVKIMDVDRSDYDSEVRARDENIKEFINETAVLQTLKDAKAKNINIIYEAFSFHSQLWIVSEYCPGGSVHTLMRACPQPGLEEKYIIAIARELAIALKHVHEVGIIHRDVKAANVLITQDGQVQLCDFGVSGVLESVAAKRSTILGTPNWMAPELITEDAAATGYGTEVDCWAFGCTVYEMATGLPPNANIAHSKLHYFLRKAPRLEGEKHSQSLKDFISFCLTERPEDRPTAEMTLKHDYIANTAKKYPTTILTKLIEQYANWEQSGGQRISLFDAYGAAGPATLDDYTGDDEWNFSTTEGFGRDIIGPSTPLNTTRHGNLIEADDSTPKQRNDILTPFEKAKEEDRILRGGMMMGRLFDQNAAEYSYAQPEDDFQPVSDLPLRNLYPTGNDERKSMIDLDAAIDISSSQNVDFESIQTVRAKKFQFLQDDEDEEEIYYNENQNLTKRLTRDWKFPSTLALPQEEDARRRTQDWSMAQATAEAAAGRSVKGPLLNVHVPPTNLAPPFRPTLDRMTTEPIGSVGDYMHPALTSLNLSSDPPDRSSMIDLDASYISQPSTAMHSSDVASISGFSSGDPFDMEEDTTLDPFGTMRQRGARNSYHMHSQSEPAVDRMTQGTSIDNHARGSSLAENPALDHYTPLSVRASIESLRMVTDDDDAPEDDWEGSFKNLNHIKYNQPPLSAPPQNTSFSSYLPQVELNDDSPIQIDLDEAIVSDGSINNHSAQSFHEEHKAQIVTPAEEIFNTRRRVRPGRVRHDSDTSGPSGNLDISAPSIRALMANSDKDVIAAELDRLLGGYVTLLQSARTIMKNDPLRDKSRLRNVT